MHTHTHASSAMASAQANCGRLLRYLSLLSIFAGANAQVLPCALGVTNLTVSNSVEANDLAEALLCSGGQFEASWVGEVLVSRTVRVSNGTSLRISGTSSGGSIVDGGGLYQLFHVSGGSTLELKGLSLVNGFSDEGGAAVAVSDASSLEVSGCSFDGNRAGAGGMSLQ